MAQSLTYYQHKRRDGGVRTGVEIDGVTALHRLQKGKREADPVLRWFVDVRCRGPKLPRDPEAARDWLLAHADTVHHALNQLAGELQGGMEPDILPLHWAVPNPPAGIKMVIVCSVTKRLDAVEASRILRNVDRNWERSLRGLKLYEPAA
jgi:hypothetical protein